MSLFESLGRSQQRQQPMSTQDAIRQLQQNPQATLQQSGMSIPDGMTDPQQMVNHLIQTGQVPQNRVTRAMQMLGMRI